MKTSASLSDHRFCSISPLNFDGSHSFIGKVTFVVDFYRLTYEVQPLVEVLFPLKLQQTDYILEQ